MRISALSFLWMSNTIGNTTAMSRLEYSQHGPRRAADLSPLRRRSRSAWIEFVWRTPRVYNEFMVYDVGQQEHTRGEEAGGQVAARSLRHT